MDRNELVQITFWECPYHRFMRPRKASGWRRWLLGMAAGGILSAVTGVTVLGAVASAGLLPTPAPTAKPAQGSLLGGLSGHSSSSSGLPLLGSPLPTLCILCSTPTPIPTPTLPITTPCLLHCPPPPSPGCTVNCGNGGGNDPGGNNGHPSTATPAPGTVTTIPGSTASGGGGGGTAVDPATPGAITIQPPPAVETLSPVAGISFGKAPFLWPLFIVLDFLGLGAVVLVLRKTWSRPVTD
jgi:hypothetical protein